MCISEEEKPDIWDVIHVVLIHWMKAAAVTDDSHPDVRMQHYTLLYECGGTTLGLSL